LPVASRTRGASGGLVRFEHIVTQIETGVQEGLVILVGRVQVLQQPEQSSAV
jgi:hypothetical protein